jgi:hypothetical protein
VAAAELSNLRLTKLVDEFKKLRKDKNDEVNALKLELEERAKDLSAANDDLLEQRRLYDVKTSEANSAASTIERLQNEAAELNQQLAQLRSKASRLEVCIL